RQHVRDELGKAIVELAAQSGALFDKCIERWHGSAASQWLGLQPLDNAKHKGRERVGQHQDQDPHDEVAVLDRQRRQDMLQRLLAGVLVDQDDRTWNKRSQPLELTQLASTDLGIGVPFEAPSLAV